jgi:hypothetical protein
MAKAKSKDNKSKDKKSGVPKKLAGVKVPKAVRESKSLSTLLTSNLGREILADALIAAAGAAAAALTRTRTAKDAGHALADAGAGASDSVQTAAGAVASVVTQAAKSFLPPSLLGEGEASDNGQKPRYLHKASDHSSRKRSKKSGKKDDPSKKRPRKTAE